MSKATKPKAISIIIADDHAFFREGLVKVLDAAGRFHVVAQAASGQELVDLATEHKPDLLIVDIGMPILNGIEAVQQLADSGIPSKVVALSMHREDSIVLRMLNAGAMGYLDKNTSKEELYEAIDSIVLNDRVYFPASTSEHMLELLRKSPYQPFPEPTAILTEREIQVIQLVCLDFTNKEIAKHLYLSPRTIESHRARIMERINVKSVSGLVVYAYTHGIYKPE